MPNVWDQAEEILIKPRTTEKPTAPAEDVWAQGEAILNQSSGPLPVLDPDASMQLLAQNARVERNRELLARDPSAGEARAFAEALSVVDLATARDPLARAFQETVRQATPNPVAAYEEGAQALPGLPGKALGTVMAAGSVFNPVAKGGQEVAQLTQAAGELAAGDVRGASESAAGVKPVLPDVKPAMTTSTALNMLSDLYVQARKDPWNAALMLEGGKGSVEGLSEIQRLKTNLANVEGGRAGLLDTPAEIAQKVEKGFRENLASQGDDYFKRVATRQAIQQIPKVTRMKTKTLTKRLDDLSTDLKDYAKENEGGLITHEGATIVSDMMATIGELKMRGVEVKIPELPKEIERIANSQEPIAKPASSEPSPKPVEPTPEPKTAQEIFEGKQAAQDAIIRGDTTQVKGTKGSKFGATYVALPRAMVQASHTGEQFSPNPNYPLVNTRNYQEPAEGQKVLDLRNNFDPDEHVTDTVSASSGPIMVAKVTQEDGSVNYPVLGGNGRKQAIDLLPPEKQAQLTEAFNKRKERFGITKDLPEGYEVYRLMGTYDLRKPGVRGELQGMVDALNPSPGLVQSVAKMAEVDAASNVPLETLTGMDMQLSPDEAQKVVGNLIKTGLVDRNLRTPIAQSGSASQDYVQRLLVNAAFRSPAIAEMRQDTRREGSIAAFRGMIDAAAPVLIKLRARGHAAVADTITKTFQTVGGALDERGVGGKLSNALSQAASQVEMGDDSETVQSLARALAGKVALTKGGRVNAAETTEGFEELFADVGRAVASYTPAPDMFGTADTIHGAIRRGLEYHAAKQKPMETASVSENQTGYGTDLQAVRKRLTELQAKRQREGLTQDEAAEMEGHERTLGQDFFDFFQKKTAEELAAERVKRERNMQQQLIHQGQARRLVGDAIVTQADLFDKPTTLFEGREGYFPGFDEALKKRYPDEKPQANREIVRAVSAGEPGDRQLYLRLRHDGEPERVGGSVARGEVKLIRAEAIPEYKGRDHLQGKSYRGVLKQHQVEGANRALDEFAQGKKAFGIFDDTGSGKTAQLLAIADGMADRSGKPILIVTERQIIIDDAFAKDAAMLKLNLHQYMGGPTAGQRILMATYFDVARGGVPNDAWGAVLFDESHNLRNADASDKATAGISLIRGTPHVVYASATPLDKPHQLYYLEPLFDRPINSILNGVGIIVEQRGDQLVFTPREGITSHDVEEGLRREFDRLAELGRAVKREVALDNLTVEVRPVELSTRDAQMVDARMQAKGAELAQRQVPERFIRAQVLMTGRALLESLKAVKVVEGVIESLGKGRQVIVYANRVNAGQIAMGGHLNAIANQLETIYPGKVGRLFGSFGMSEGERGVTVAKFQGGTFSILVATPEMAGTGINLDDIHGDRARDLHLVTPPFSAIAMKQLAGRVNRLTTKSKARVMMYLTNHAVDHWNMGIVLAKLRNLKATVAGDMGRLLPTREDILLEREAVERYVAEQKIPNAPAATAEILRMLETARAQGDAYQLEFDYGRQRALSRTRGPVNTTGDKGVALGSAVSGGGSSLSEEIFGSKWRPPTAYDFSESGVLSSTVRERIPELIVGQKLVNLIGLRLKGPQDVSLALQAVRSPLVESLKVLVMRGNKVIHSEVVSVGTVNTTEVPKLLIQRLARKFGGDGVIISHNHPSGDVTPSKDDYKATTELRDYLGLHGVKLLDHVITNGKKYYSYMHGRDQTLPEELQVKPDWERVRREDLRYLANDPRHIAALVAQLVSGDPNHVHLVFTTAQRYLTALERVPLRKLVTATGSGMNVLALKERLVEGAKREGGAHVHLSMPDHLSSEYAGKVWADLCVEWRDDHALWQKGKYGDFPVIELTDMSWHGRSVPNPWRQDRTAKVGGMSEDRAKYQDAEVMVGSGVKLVNAKGDMYADVPLAHMDQVRIVQMPELVKLARALMGELPQLRKLRGVLGHFKPIGGGRIVLDPRIFNNPQSAAKTLAHEIGHLVDYLPEETMKRGNLLGRLLSLRNFFKNTFGAMEVTDKVLRAELLGLTKYWKPYDEGKVSKSYNEYRRSAVELYADAVSVLFNSPATLKGLAPKFYEEFFKALDKKTEVKKEFFELQEFLNRPAMEVLKDRAVDIQDMFAKGEEIFLRKMEERRLRHATFRGFRQRIMQEVFDIFEPIVAKQREIEDGGGTVPLKDRVDWLTEEHPLADNMAYRFLEKMFRTVVQPTEAASFSLTDLGELLFLNRVLNERVEVTKELTPGAEPTVEVKGRSVIANPLGITPEVARLQLLRMRIENGMNAMTLLESGVARFHDLVFEVVQEAAKVGLINSVTFETVIKPNKKNYATFVPIDHVDVYVPSGIYKQVGTLREVANPFVSTVLKTITLQRAIQWQKAKMGVVRFLNDYFPNEVRPAAMVWDGSRMRPRPPKDPSLALLELKVDGKMVAYEVEREIVAMFEHVAPASANAITATLNWAFRNVFYPVMIKYNPYFMLFSNPLRDFQRTYANLPDKVSFGKMMRAWAGAMGDASSKLKGVSTPIVAEMIENFAFGTPYDSFARGRGKEDAFEGILQKFNMLPENERKGFLDSALLKPVVGLFKGIEFAGDTMFEMPKIGAYRVLTRELKWSPREAAAYVRNYVGVPNYMRRGRYTNIAGSVIPFISVFLNGYRDDIRMMRGKAYGGRSAAAWWLKWARTDGIWMVLATLAELGILGATLKRHYEGVSEYDKTNYRVIPLGSIPGGEYGEKIVAMRIPPDFTHRMLNGLLRKGIMLAARKVQGKPSLEGLGGILEFGGGEVPSLNPTLTLAKNWAAYLEGKNPVDDFRGRTILSNNEWLAGGWDSFKPMLGWTWNETGLASFVRYDKHADTTMELALGLSPIVGRVIKTTDQGFREMQLAKERQAQVLKAEVRLAMPENVQSLLTEYSFLRGIGKLERTPAQDVRWAEISQWYNAIYTPIHEAIAAQSDVGGIGSTKGIREQLGKASEAFKRGENQPAPGATAEPKKKQMQRATIEELAP